jgi:hypothetical protein
MLSAFFCPRKYWVDRCAPCSTWIAAERWIPNLANHTNNPPDWISLAVGSDATANNEMIVETEISNYVRLLNQRYSGMPPTMTSRPNPLVSGSR